MEFEQAFLTLGLVHLLAAASPGPDFVMVSRQSLVQGRRAGLLCSLGIALGLSVHIGYSALGLAALVEQSTVLMTVLKWLAAAYLLYLGWCGLRSGPAVAADESSPTPEPASTSRLILLGFLCNALNPKAPLYFLSVFTLVLSPDMPGYQLVLLGAWMMLLQWLWFSAVAWFLSAPLVRHRFQRLGHWIDRVLGSVFLLLGLRLLWSSWRQ